MPADVYGKAGQPQAGLDRLAEALALVEETRELVDEAQLHRLKGELLLWQSSEGSALHTGHEEAEACFHTAIAVARAQGARSLELQAAFSLARRWRAQGKTDAARHALAEIHGSFSEGFDLPDWKQAKALLDDLN
ncbi:hypothetical protein [uncultured Ralstonia sp.]|uniref:hypothetical protein n=1 Tax=uncultured Ralstonia sp. TaxID=114715 RepID=UPI001EAB3AE9|nr:hypothetical protein [uncultured Ralstonia sp.]UCF23804.1 MAG: hypothetical protein JSV72_23950 [Ralstonia sp.]